VLPLEAAFKVIALGTSRT